MSLADELLDSLTENQTDASTIEDSNEPHIVIDPNKDIIVPDELKEIAVQREHNVKTVTFDCPRYWDGRDLMKTTIYINYERNDGVKGRYPATNVRVDSDDPTMIHFDWTVSRHVTESFGDITILVCGIRVDSDGIEEKHWNSHRHEEMTVAEGLECGDEIADMYPDEITVILAKMQSLENHTHTAKDIGAIPEGGDPGSDVVFKNVKSLSDVSANCISITHPQCAPLNLYHDNFVRKAPSLHIQCDPSDEEEDVAVLVYPVRAPEEDTDAANKKYVDEVAAAILKALESLDKYALAENVYDRETIDRILQNLDKYATTDYVDDKIGDINGILSTLSDGGVE